MLTPGTYLEMCSPFGANLQRGMNFRLRNSASLILMSIRPRALYEDRLEEGGRVLVYEGHDEPRRRGGSDPESVDQPEFLPNGRRTQNGRFINAGRRFKLGQAAAERVRVFEKIREGIWVHNGLFELIDGWQENTEKKQVFKFKLQIIDEILHSLSPVAARQEIDNDRVIPSKIKVEVGKRDRGRCVLCRSKENLHFDHDIPYAQGGCSKSAENTQILCTKHNLEKKDNLQ